MKTNANKKTLDDRTIGPKDSTHRSSTKFEKLDTNNNIVIAFDGAWMHDSSILDVFADRTQNQVCYSIDCKEWSEYDEFVTKERLLKLTKNAQKIKHQIDFLAALDRKQGEEKLQFLEHNISRYDDKKYKKRERIIVYESFLLYDAVVSRTKLEYLTSINKKTMVYFVHYPGWSKEWDDWMTSEKMFKRTADAVRIKETLFRYWDIENIINSTPQLQQSKPLNKSKKRVLKSKKKKKVKKLIPLNEQKTNISKFAAKIKKSNSKDKEYSTETEVNRHKSKNWKLTASTARTI